eukprot:TRINITY_DN4691_c0_g1_i1.p1 TRINITY_DN4691_c0_g1~~TRINITY_DN4691_c0_g1_i1.p1  ORF type:complete len:335 (-),score=39.88 TRINITY_DN4691_c0_g1_i1:116-1120(-)
MPMWRVLSWWLLVALSNVDYHFGKRTRNNEMDLSSKANPCVGVVCGADTKCMDVQNKALCQCSASYKLRDGRPAYYASELGHYAFLGVSPDASSDEIRKVYKKLALQYHPDKNTQNPEAAAAKFKELQAAMDDLSDDRKRALYDSSKIEKLKCRPQSTFQPMQPVRQPPAAAHDPYPRPQAPSRNTGGQGPMPPPKPPSMPRPPADPFYRPQPPSRSGQGASPPKPPSMPRPQPPSRSSGGQGPMPPPQPPSMHRPQPPGNGQGRPPPPQSYQPSGRKTFEEMSAEANRYFAGQQPERDESRLPRMTVPKPPKTPPFRHEYPSRAKVGIDASQK